MRLTRIVLAGLLLLLCVPLAAAQTAGTMEIGDTITGEVSPSSSAPSYFFNAQADQILTVQLTTSVEGFMPVLLVADDQNNVVETFGDAVDGRVGGTITIPADGRYFVQVQGANATQGEFNLSLLEGDLPLDVATPTPAPETTDAADGVIAVQIGDIIEADFEQPERQFTLAAADAPLLLQVFGSALSPSLRVSLTNDASGEIVGSYRAPLTAGAFVITAHSGVYTLAVSHGESDPSVSVVVSLSEFSGGTLLQPPQPAPTVEPSPTLPPTPEPTSTPTPAPPQDIDALLTWSDTVLMFTNISGVPLDIRMLSFTGSSRSVDMTFWGQGNPALNLSAFPPNKCAGFRPLAYPDAPPLPPGCIDLAAWYSADIVHFWRGESFDVRYNGSVIATCPTSEGQCGIDLPGA